MPTRPPARPPTRLSNDRESSLKAPLLKEFGITPEEYEEYKSAPERYEARVNQAADATAIVAGIIYGLIRHEAGLLAATFAGLAAWMGAWIVAHIIARFIVSLRADSATTRHPAHSRISRYEAAQAQYEAAEAKHEAARLAYQTTLQQYWRSLGSRQFEIALAELYGLMGYKATATQCSRDGGVPTSSCGVRTPRSLSSARRTTSLSAPRPSGSYTARFWIARQRAPFSGLCLRFFKQRAGVCSRQADSAGWP